MTLSAGRDQAMDTMAGVEFSPAEYVDISDVIEGKLDAFRAHASQLTWLNEHDGVGVRE
ncbi:LmbE family N-acetylglucosaminyl deacetylase [Rhodococcus sp. 27YEA15]|uniref:hypothetical protein n=1 Tax=Rhodococcus sp. 27YEA15 TaxID=3156259 RepID=UPI003C7D5DB0